MHIHSKRKNRIKFRTTLFAPLALFILLAPSSLTITEAISITSSPEVVASVRLPISPVYLAYSPITKQVYITDGFTNEIVALSGANIVKSIGPPLSGFFLGMAFDYSTGNLYVAHTRVIGGFLDLPNLVVINNQDNIIGRIWLKIGAQVSQISYDPANSDLYVLEEGFVQVVNTACNCVIKTVSLPSSFPTFPMQPAIAYNPSNQEIYVTNSFNGAEQVAIISSATSTVVATMTIGQIPSCCKTVIITGIAYNPITREMYVTTQGEVVAINGSTEVGTINLPYSLTGGGATAFDVADLSLWVTNPVSGQIYLITPLNTVSTDILNLPLNAPTRLVYDISIREMYVSNGYSSVLLFSS